MQLEQNVGLLSYLFSLYVSQVRQTLGTSHACTRMLCDLDGLQAKPPAWVITSLIYIPCLFRAAWCRVVSCRATFCLLTLPIFLRRHGNRTSPRLHPTHAQLWSLASGPHRERYEELRAAYNPVRPEGSSPAPPYEEWRGMSDICDDPDVFCRYIPGVCTKACIPGGLLYFMPRTTGPA